MHKLHKLTDSFVYLLFVSIGIITILYQIHFDDFWLDEWASFWVADPNLTYSETILRHNESDWHNPKLFNFLLKFFLSFVGYEAHLARYLPFIFGSASLIMIGAISYQVQRSRSFLLTTFLACISVYIIKYSQELRPYSLLLLTSSLNIFFYIDLINSSKKKTKKLFIFYIFFGIELFSSSFCSNNIFLSNNLFYL